MAMSVCVNCGRAHRMHRTDLCGACYQYQGAHGVNRPTVFNSFLAERQPDDALTTTEVAVRTGIGLRVLRSWVHRDLVTPSYAVGFGSGVHWWWSPADVVFLASLKARIDWGMTVEGALRRDDPPSLQFDSTTAPPK